MPSRLDSSPRGHAPRLSVAVSVLCLCAFGLLTAAVVSHHADGLDSRVPLWVVDHRSSAATSVMKVVTWLGSTVLLYPAVIVIGALLWWRQRDLRPGAALAGALIGAVVLYGAIKPIFGRARPPEQLAVGTYPGWAFPSGHVPSNRPLWHARVHPLARARGSRLGSGRYRGDAHGRRLTDIPLGALVDRRPWRLRHRGVLAQSRDWCPTAGKGRHHHSRLTHQRRRPAATRTSGCLERLRAAYRRADHRVRELCAHGSQMTWPESWSTNHPPNPADTNRRYRHRRSDVVRDT